MQQFPTCLYLKAIHQGAILFSVAAQRDDYRIESGRTAISTFCNKAARLDLVEAEPGSKVSSKGWSCYGPLRGVGVTSARRKCCLKAATGSTNAASTPWPWTSPWRTVITSAVSLATTTAAVFPPR